MVVKAEAEKKASSGLVRGFAGFFIVFIILLVFFQFSGGLDNFQYLSLLFTLSFLFVSSMSVIIAGRQLDVSELQESAAREAILATRDQIKATVRPYLHFLIRPESHLKDPHITFSRTRWVPGVGIYVENIGSGPAIDFKISCNIIARDGSIRSCERSFGGSRLLPGQRYSYPSTDWDEPRIKIDDEKITIDTEYKDRLGNHHKQEPMEIELDRLFFTSAQINV